MDLLAELLNQLHIRSTIYFATHFRAPWSLVVPEFQNVARFHMVLGGHFWVRVDQDWELLEPGEVVVIPKGKGHVIADDPKSTPVQLESALQGYQRGIFQFGGEVGSEVRLICGHFEFSDDVQHPLLKALPDLLLGRGVDWKKMGWFSQTLSFLTSEVDLKRPGQAIVQQKLTEILFVELIRHWIEFGHPYGILKAFKDPVVLSSLEIMHQKFREPWTVHGLARELGLSRTGFYNRFQSILGQTPMEYLTDWRMRKAKLYLKANESVDEVSYLVGYQSVAAFNRRFKSHFGLTASQFRKSCS